jgi:hypothetical protein
MTEITWRKSSYSGGQGDCVEVGQLWRKSSYSASQGGCVEVAKAPADVHVRDTKDRASGSLTFGQASWRTFLVGLSTGR